MTNLFCSEELPTDNSQTQPTLMDLWKPKRTFAALSSDDQAPLRKKQQSCEPVPRQDSPVFHHSTAKQLFHHSTAKQQKVAERASESEVRAYVAKMRTEYLCMSAQELYRHVKPYVQRLVRLKNMTIGIERDDTILSEEIIRLVKERTNVVVLIQMHFSIRLDDWEIEVLDERDIEWTTQFVVDFWR